MCNRFRSIKEWAEIPRYLHNGPRLNFDFNPNVAPTELVPVFLAQPVGPSYPVLARFGINLIGKDGKPRAPLLNARTDGMRRGQFRGHLQKQRCIIPVAGFYEWREEDGKQPYYFSRKDEKPLVLAGIWEQSEYKGDKRIAFAILTEDPNDLIAPYHDRMPLALAENKVLTWLDLAEDALLGQDLLLDLDAFAVRPMNRAMNSVRQKDLAAIDPLAA
jgi:putative SOS response-associated peptidase YedK